VDNPRFPLWSIEGEHIDGVTTITDCFYVVWAEV
jgi:hypothetical protein